MDKRYQVFISSTYADLKEERRKVIQTVMEMDCIPSGMELFPAVDEEQWAFIQKIIDDCDYYLLIIGGRYGSTTSEGVSYTEKEFDYALQRGMKVIAFLREDTDVSGSGSDEEDPEIQARLRAFREKVSMNRLVRYWNSAEELPGLVSLSLSKTIKMYPAVGWIRADRAPSEELLGDLNDLRKQNSQLQAEITGLRAANTIDIRDLASFDDAYTVTGKRWIDFRKRYEDFSLTITWREIFDFIAPFLSKFPSDETVQFTLNRWLSGKPGLLRGSVSVSDESYHQIRTQFEALRLITTTYSKTTQGGMALFWALTPKGKKLMYEHVAVRTERR